MPFVHSLAKVRADGKAGWCAPRELGEAAPHYISFVIPVREDRSFFDQYNCEAVIVRDGERTIEPHVLAQRGDDSFALRVKDDEFWFSVRPSPKDEHYLAYIGKLHHHDFRHALVEIEPEDPAALDDLFENRNTFIIGCEPFVNYKP